MAEWSNATVLKTAEGVSLPGVRIPLPPPGLKIGMGRRNCVAPAAGHNFASLPHPRKFVQLKSFPAIRLETKKPTK